MPHAPHPQFPFSLFLVYSIPRPGTQARPRPRPGPGTRGSRRPRPCQRHI